MITKPVIWIAHESVISGANLVLLEWMLLLKEKGYVQYLVVPNKGSMSERAEKLGFTIKVIHFYSWVLPVSPKAPRINFLRKAGRNAIAVSKICSYISQINPGIICTNTSVISVGAIAAFIMR